MRKKRPQSSGNYGCIILMLIFSVLAFAGIFAGFYLIENGRLFAKSDNLNISSVADMNPDATQIPETSTAITPDTDPGNPTFAAILNDLNDARRAAGLNSLIVNSYLNRAAAEQAVYTASIYSATHSDANGNHADSRVEAQGYSWQNVGENLLANWSIDGHEVFMLWQGSPTHNDNMMNPAYTEIGLAYMVTPIGQVYHAMVLARPR